MKAGQLRELVKIQSPSSTQDEYGYSGSAWSDVFTTGSGYTHASVQPVNGREYFSGREMQNPVTHRVRMRFQSGVIPKMRVLVGGSRILQIESVINVDERDRELVLMCKELV